MSEICLHYNVYTRVVVESIVCPNIRPLGNKHGIFILQIENHHCTGYVYLIDGHEILCLGNEISMLWERDLMSWEQEIIVMGVKSYIVCNEIIMSWERDLMSSEQDTCI